MKVITKQPNLKIFRLECDDTPSKNSGTVRIYCYGACVYKEKDIRKQFFASRKANDLLKMFLSRMPASELQKKLTQTLNYKNIPAEEEIKELLILHKLSE